MNNTDKFAITIVISNWDEIKLLIDELQNHPTTTDAERQYYSYASKEGNCKRTDFVKIMNEYNRKIGFFNKKFKISWGDEKTDVVVKIDGNYHSGRIT